MDRTVLPQALSGGYLGDHTIDLGEASFSFRVDVLNQGNLVVYEVFCRDVSFFEYKDAQRGILGDRVQLTELWIERTPERSPSEEWELLLSLWDLAHVRVRCGSVIVDGDRLV